MRRIVILVAAVLVVLAGAGTTNAQRAVHFNDVIDLNATFEAADLDAACGFDVTVTVSGAVDVTLIYNAAGRVVREIDTTGGATLTFSSSNGSFSFPMAVTGIYTYPGGATLGSTANVRLAGFIGHVPGFLPSDAGIDIITNAVVIDFTPEGIPVVDFTEETSFSSHGPRASGEEIETAICAALSP